MATIIMTHGIIADEDKDHRSEETETIISNTGEQDETEYTDDNGATAD